MNNLQLSSEFLHYLASRPATNGAVEGDGAAPGSERLPALQEVSKELGVSVALLREQLEVARALGLVEVRPRTGIRRQPYTFLPAVRLSLSYALAVDPGYFAAYSDLRNHIEAAYWYEAVRRLEPADHARLRALLVRAWARLNGNPVQIPHEEHRQLHLAIYSRLENPFVTGLLEAFWEAYESVGLNLYADYGYLQQVWGYHQEMVDAICAGEFERGYRALEAHKDLLYHRPTSQGTAFNK